jgi:hypothetical protein
VQQQDLSAAKHVQVLLGFVLALCDRKNDFVCFFVQVDKVGQTGLLTFSIKLSRSLSLTGNLWILLAIADFT